MNKIFVFYFLFIISTVYSYEMNWSPYIIQNHEITFLYCDDDVIVKFSNSGDWIKIIQRFDSFEDGYIKITGVITTQTDRLYLLEGINVLLLEQYIYPYDWKTHSISMTSIHDSPLICQSISLDEWHARKYNLTEEHITHEGWNRVTLYEDGVSVVMASSVLEEKKSDGSVISYEANGANDRLFFVTGDGEVSLYYDNLTPPWVEGVEGYGIGEYLDIEFKYASDEIQVLNGFVDFRRMHLYKDNSRVKRVRVESGGPAFTEEYDFEDVVRYNLIRLPKKTKKIRMTILEVYPGRKWQDTAISSILATDPDQPPYEEQKVKLIELMKANGVWDKIEQYKRNMSRSDGKR